MSKRFSLLLGIFVLACGGSVKSEGGNAGAGASGGSGGSGATGGGASGGAGAVGGSGAYSGGAGVAGAGAVGGSGGYGGGCCNDDLECPQWFEGDSEDEPYPGGSACVSGVCVAAAPPGRCWRDADCGKGVACKGAFVCPCDMDCAAADQLGWCESTPPPTPYCCKTDWDCGDFAYVPCVNDVCKMPVPGACWKDTECPQGKKCVGAFACPCGAACSQEDQPGKCK